MHPKSVLISVLSLSRTSTPLEAVNPLAAMYVWLVMPQIGTLLSVLIFFAKSGTIFEGTSRNSACRTLRRKACDIAGICHKSRTVPGLPDASKVPVKGLKKFTNDVAKSMTLDEATALLLT